MTDAERELMSLVIGHRIRTTRKSMKLSQSDLALGIVSQSLMSLIESGRHLPLPDVLHALAKRLQDDVLLRYAGLLEGGQITVTEMSSIDHQDLLDALRAHRGHWLDIHLRVALQLCQYYYYAGEFEKSLDISRMIMNHNPDAATLGQSSYFCGSSLLCQMNYEEARVWLHQSEQHMDTFTPEQRGRLYYNLGYMYTQTDIQVLAVWYAKKAVDQFHGINDFKDHAISLSLLGVVQNRLGNFDDSLQSLLLSYDILNRWDIGANDKARILANLGDVCESLNRLDLAETYCSQAISTMASDQPDFSCLSGIYRVLGVVYIKRNALDDSLRFLCKAIESAQKCTDIQSIAISNLLYASYARFNQEKVHAALKAYEVTLHTDYHIIHALAAEILAVCLHNDGQPEEALLYTQAALHAYRKYTLKNSMFSSLIQLIEFNRSI